MSATEHTPGNWHMSDKDAIIEVWAGDTPIAVMEGPTDEAERANAARMAAAPDLLTGVGASIAKPVQMRQPRLLRDYGASTGRCRHRKGQRRMTAKIAKGQGRMPRRSLKFAALSWP